MRIAEVPPWYPPHLGGVELACQSMSRALVGLGHSVVVVTPTGWHGDGPSRQTADADGVAVTRHRALEVARTPLAPGLLTGILRARPQLIHAHISQAVVPELAFTAARILRVPIIAHFHMDVPATRFARLFALYKDHVLGRVLRHADAVVTLSEQQAAFVREHYHVMPQGLAVVPNGVDEIFFTGGTERRLHDPRRILFVGRLSPQKNVDRLLLACASLPMAYHLRICGDGSERERLERLAAHVGVDAEFAGARTRTQLIEDYAQADVLVSSSDREGMALSVLEAFAGGLPVVATDVDGNRTLVGGVGELVRPTPDGIRDGLIAVLQDPHRWQELRHRSTRRADTLHWDRAATDLAAIFSRTLADPRIAS